ARITSQQPSPPQQATYRYTTAASPVAPLSSSDPSPGLHGAGRSLMALSVPEGEFVFSGEGFAASEIDFSGTGSWGREGGMGDVALTTQQHNGITPPPTLWFADSGASKSMTS
ncbi:unnamed protein product, partial [Pylaiella littoralis]